MGARRKLITLAGVAGTLLGLGACAARPSDDQIQAKIRETRVIASDACQSKGMSPAVTTKYDDNGDVAVYWHCK